MRLALPQGFGLASLLLLFALLALAPYVIQLQAFELRLLTLIFLYALLGQGWNVLGGFAGQTSIGHGMFFGLGAYTATLLAVRFDVNAWIGMGAGALAAAIVGVLIGLPCFRLKGHYFVIATLVVAEILYQLAAAWPFVGGASGLSLPIKPAGFLHFQFHRDRIPYYQIALAMLAAVTLFAWCLRESRLGFILRAIRDDEDAARSLGFASQRCKLIAMAMSAAITGAGGVFYAQYVLFIDPASVLSSAQSVLIALIPIFGGIGTIAGPLVGAAVLMALSEYARIWFSGTGRNVDLLIYGLLIMVVAVYRPDGVTSLFRVPAMQRLFRRQGAGPVVSAQAQRDGEAA
ncbi:branched-chain amino acid ABC transporter permease [Roseomonas chloroacetimidivorans]|uniref:branched-chain amino acid ABC transporter permease n=1 Tax=Roseomonas chloroacetimidivorans TaxID=1766656 RepID=UPI003C75CA7D